MVDIIEVADSADVIVDGYAFTKCDTGYRVLNLNNPEKAVMFLKDESVAETTMDDIELQIVIELFKSQCEVYGGLICQSIISIRLQAITCTSLLTVLSSVCMYTQATVN